MPKVTADQIYSLLSKHQLTPEQRAVVEGAPVDAPALVIAGAGSGKTELMTVRVLYLVANGLAKPSEILGLTFTRKAASELSNRVNSALYKLRESDLWPLGLDFDFAEANITTYNSFGNDIFRRLSLAIGYEQDASLLSEATAISLAEELLSSLGSDMVTHLGEWDKTKAYLADLILQLSAELTDNQATSEQMTSILEDFISHISALPQTSSGSMTRYAYVEEMISSARQNQMLADLAGRYQQLKARRHLVDFSDQVALALKVASDQREVQYRFVLLDEYQDTSSIQTQLLSSLFASRAVLAVGDPNQAIYGWRGASSNNLSNFHQDFQSADPVTFTLSRSWRSGPAVVSAANLITGPLNSAQPDLVPVSLTPGREDVDDLVVAEVFQDENSEARAIADWLKLKLTQELSAAVLVRTKAPMQLIADELARAGLAYEVTGLSSLIQMPEVVDLISALSVIERPDAGAQLMRLLSGAKWRIGPKDLASLSNLAGTLSRIREVPKNMPLTIVEALDELRFESTRKLADFSELGLARLVQASELFHQLRSISSISLTELCWAIVRELELDIELFAHSPAPNPLVNLEAFIARIAEFEQASNHSSVGNLLSWLDQAREKESFELPKSGAKKGVVQLMTVHSAKGLEWDLVAVAQLNQGSFPIESRSAKGWLSAAKLPFPLRGDVVALPKFDYRSAQTQKELKANFEEFQLANKARSSMEERRLAYVAFTRAKSELFLTASHFKASAKKPRAISPFLQELLDSGLASLRQAIPVALDANPIEDLLDIRVWPADPLGSKRQQLEKAASQLQQSEPAKTQDFIELSLLLEERERRNWLTGPEIPKRLSASKILKLIDNPEQFSNDLLRPVPQLFDAKAELGSNFHARLEQIFLSGSELELETWAEDEKDFGVNFAGSRFATLQPRWVEQPIEFQLAGQIVVCKIDAIFETGLGFEVVDWKSGSAPKNADDLQLRAIQLALYRLAFSKWQSVPLERIRASFFFAADGVEISPDNLLSEQQLVSAIEKARTTRRD